jgi:periplasmic protein TonB
VIARVLPWFEDEDPRQFLRWSLAAAAVVCAHAGLIAAYMLLHHPEEEIGDDTQVITIQLAPIENVADSHQRDIAPGPDDMVEQKLVPQVEKQVVQPKIEQPPPPPDATIPDVTLPKPVTPEQVEPERPPAPRTTARVEGGTPRVEPTWEAVLVKHLQQYKSYPQTARDRTEQGVVVLGFTVDRNGRVLARRIVKSSGYRALDDEVLAMIERAQPLPAFPASMTQAKLDLMLPIRFSLH